MLSTTEEAETKSATQGHIAKGFREISSLNSWLNSFRVWLNTSGKKTHFLDKPDQKRPTSRGNLQNRSRNFVPVRMSYRSLYSARK